MTFFRLLLIVCVGVLLYVYGWPLLKSRLNPDEGPTSSETENLSPSVATSTPPAAHASTPTAPTATSTPPATSTPAPVVRSLKSGDVAKLKRPVTVPIPRGEMVASAGQPVRIQQVSGNMARIVVFGSTVDVPLSDLE